MYKKDMLYPGIYSEGGCYFGQALLKAFAVLLFKQCQLLIHTIAMSVKHEL